MAQKRTKYASVLSQIYRFMHIPSSSRNRKTLASRHTCVAVSNLQRKYESDADVHIFSRYFMDSLCIIHIQIF